MKDRERMNHNKPKETTPKQNIFKLLKKKKKSKKVLGNIERKTTNVHALLSIVQK